MSHPLRDHVEWHALDHRVDAIAMPEPLRHGVRAVLDAGVGQNGLDPAPGGRARPRPELRVAGAAFAKAVDQVEQFDKPIWDRHDAKHAAAALLERLERQGAFREIDATAGKAEHLRDSGATVMERLTEAPDLARRRFRSRKEGLAFPRVEIQPLAPGVEQVHLKQMSSNHGEPQPGPPGRCDKDRALCALHDFKGLIWFSRR